MGEFSAASAETHICFAIDQGTLVLKVVGSQSRNK
jgi:hypothetical protein